MKRLLLIPILTLAALTVWAQTANVIELEPYDTARAQKAWDALQKAQVEWDLERGHISGRYVEKSCGPNENKLIIGSACSVPGFESGFEFSKDFRFIVPKQPDPKSPIQYNLSGSYLTQPNCANGACY